MSHLIVIDDRFAEKLVRVGKADSLSDVRQAVLDVRGMEDRTASITTASRKLTFKSMRE